MQKQVTENSKNRKTKEENTRKVSVVMTIYNGRKYLYEQLDSIAKQTRQPDEVIILDDKSSDDSVKVTLDFIAEHNIENWKVVQNETNLGWRANFKKGFDLCSGDYIFPCDQDDIWHKDKIEKMLNIMVRYSSIGVLTCNYTMIVSEKDKGSNSYRNVYLGMKNDGQISHLENMKKWCYIARPGCTFCITRDLYEDIKGEWDLTLAHDSQIWRKAYVRKNLYLYNEALIDFRRHGDNATSMKGASMENRLNDIRVYKRYHAEALDYIKKNRRDDITEIENLTKCLGFLRLREEFIEKKRLWKWLILFLFYREYYYSSKGCFGDLLYTIKN